MNFHSFGYRVIREHAPALGIDPGVDVATGAELRQIERTLELRFLAGRSVVSVQTSRVISSHETSILSDNVSFTLEFEDGSIGTIHYLANGHKAVPKERLEVYCDGRILQLDNFRRLRGSGWPGLRNMNLLKQDKGQTHFVAAFVDAVRAGGLSPTPYDEMVEVTEVSFQVAEAAAR